MIKMILLSASGSVFISRDQTSCERVKLVNCAGFYFFVVVVVVLVVVVGTFGE